MCFGGKQVHRSNEVKSLFQPNKKKTSIHQQNQKMVSKYFRQFSRIKINDIEYICLGKNLIQTVINDAEMTAREARQTHSKSYSHLILPHDCLRKNQYQIQKQKKTRIESTSKTFPVMPMQFLCLKDLISYFQIENS